MTNLIVTISDYTNYGNRLQNYALTQLLSDAYGETTTARFQSNLPTFKHKDPRTYNYLPPKAVHCLHKCLRSRFDVQLWNDLHLVHPKAKMLKELIEAWMESHGIEFDETNWCAISKRYQRKRELYRKKNAPK